MRKQHNSPSVQSLSRVKTVGGKDTPMSSSRPVASASIPYRFGQMPVYPSGIATIQPKLYVNAPGDAYEREAEQAAARIGRMQRAPGADRPLMRKAESGGGYEASPALTAQLRASKGGGAPLPEGTRRQMEGAFGRDFSQVRAHTDATAAEMSRGIQARAFTHGRDIFFNSGEYRPGAAAGRELLAHELAHVVQQGEGSASLRPSHSGSSRHSNISYIQRNQNPTPVDSDASSSTPRIPSPHLFLPDHREITKSFRDEVLPITQWLDENPPLGNRFPDDIPHIIGRIRQAVRVASSMAEDRIRRIVLNWLVEKHYMSKPAEGEDRANPQKRGTESFLGVVISDMLFSFAKGGKTKAEQRFEVNIDNSFILPEGTPVIVDCKNKRDDKSDKVECSLGIASDAALKHKGEKIKVESGQISFLIGLSKKREEGGQKVEGQSQVELQIFKFQIKVAKGVYLSSKGSFTGVIASVPEASFKFSVGVQIGDGKKPKVFIGGFGSSAVSTVKKEVEDTKKDVTNVDDFLGFGIKVNF